MEPVTSNRTFALPAIHKQIPQTIIPVTPAVPNTSSRKGAPQKTFIEYLDHIPASHPLTARQQQGLKREEDKLLCGPTARVPMVCKGLQCPFISHCPLAKNQVMLPLDRDCPVEAFAIDSWKAKFLVDLEIEKQENSAQIIAIVDDLAVEVALATRVLWKASLDPDPLQKNVIGTNFKGDPLEVQQLSPILDFLLRIHDRKLKKLRELLVTPRSKAEAGRLGFDDPASKAASAQVAASKLLKDLDGPQTQIARLGDFTKRGAATPENSPAGNG